MEERGPSVVAPLQPELYPYDVLVGGGKVEVVCIGNGRKGALG